MNATQEQWTAAAKSFPQTSNINTLHKATETLFTQMNHLHPFSLASTILDVGTGSGNCLARLISTYGSQLPPTTRLIASDFSSGMVEQVQQRQLKEQETNPLWRKVEVKILDAQDLAEIQDREISHLTGTHVYNLVTDPRKALHSAVRVLKPDGVIGMTTVSVAEWMELMALAARKIRGNEAPGFELPVGFSTVEGIKEEFNMVGLKEVFVDEVESFMDVTDPGSFVDGFIKSENPGALMFVGGYREDELEGFVQEWVRLVRERYPEEPRLLKGVSIVAVGKK